MALDRWNVLMANKEYYFGVVFLVVMGLAIGIFITPSADQVAFMHLSDKKYKQALVQYKQLYKEGNKTADVLIPLADLNTYYGNHHAAIELLQEYLEQHDDSVRVREKLEKLLFQTQRYAERKSMLRQLIDHESTEENLRQLAFLYFQNQEYTSLIKVLRQLISLPTYKPVIKDYEQLLALSAYLNEIEIFKEVVQKMFIAMGNKVSRYQVESIATFLLQANEHEFYTDVLGDYARSVNNTDLAIQLAEMAKESSAQEVVEGILEPFAATEMREKSNLRERLKIQISLGREKDVIAYMDILMRNNELPDDMVDNFVQLVIKNKQESLYSHIIEYIDFSRIYPSISLDFLEAVLVSEKSSVLQENLWAKLSLIKGGDKSTLLIWNVMKVIRLQVPLLEEQDLEPFETQLLLEEKSVLGRIYLNAGLRNRAVRMVSELPMRKKIEALGYYEVTRYYEDDKYRQKALRHMQSVLVESDHQQYSPFYHSFILLSMVKETNVEEILEVLTKRELSLNYLSDYYYWSFRFNNDEIRVKVAELLYAKYPTTLHKEYVLDSYVQTERYAEAFDLLKLQEDKDESDVNLMTYVIAKLRDQLGESYDPAMYVEAVQNVYQHVRSKDWFSYDVERQFAYTLLDLEFTVLGEHVLFDLSKTRDPFHEDIYELVRIWETQSAPENRVDWLKKRFESTKAKHQVKWGEFLIQLGRAEDVLLVLESMDILSDQGITDLYMSAMVDLNRVDELVVFVQKQIEVERDPVRLRKLALLASDIGIAKSGDTIKTMRLIYNAVEDKTEIGRELAVLLFYEKQYDEAYTLLNDYFKHHNTEDYYAHYVFAQLLERRKDNKQAQAYFNNASMLIQKQKTKSVAVLLLEASLLLRNKEIDKSLGVYEKLIKLHPNNKKVRAEYGRTLMSIGEFEKAEEVLSVQ